VPDFARAAVAAFAEQRPVGSLTDALADFLHRQTGQRVPPEAWRPEALPAHLNMNYRVLDDANRDLGASRDLAALRRQLGDQARQSLAEAVAPQTRDALTRWDFGDLPEQVEITRGPRKLAAFPALVAEAVRVDLRLIDSPLTARRQHRRGVCRLLWLAFPDLLRQTERDLSTRLKPAALHYLVLDKSLGAEALLRDVLDAAARAALGQDAAEIRRQTTFESAAQSARPHLVAHARESARLAAECLAHAHALAQQLARPSPHKATIADLQAQLHGLVFPGFVAALAPARLVHLPRYLKAMEKRLEKLASHPERDAHNLRLLSPLLTQWQARAQRERDGVGLSAELEEFRWLLEELRVSLFAQALKTPEPVSVKRLEKRWAEINR